jgi:hypothetical protein
MITFFVFLFSSSSFASDEIIFDIESKRGVIDRYTDPTLKIWEKFSTLSEICYKNADAEQALKEIMYLRDEEILFDFDTEEFIDAGVVGPIISITIMNPKKLDDGLTENEASVTHDIVPCEF